MSDDKEFPETFPPLSSHPYKNVYPEETITRFREVYRFSCFNQWLVYDAYLISRLTHICS